MFDKANTILRVQADGKVRLHPWESSMSAPKLTVIPGGAPAPRRVTKSGKPAAYPWSQEAVDLAQAAGYYWSGGRIAVALAPHVKRDGWDWVKRVWQAYLSSRPYLDWDIKAAQGKASGEPVKDVRFVNPQDFAQTYGFWDLRVTPSYLKPIKQQQHITGDLSTPPERPAA
jgi:hypothetical protein